MRRICLGIAGIVVAATLVGCGDTGPQDGAVPFKGTSTEPFNAMTNEMKKTTKAQVEAKKPEGDAKATPEPKAAEPKATAEPKSTGDTKAEPKPKSP